MQQIKNFPAVKTQDSSLIAFFAILVVCLMVALIPSLFELVEMSASHGYPGTDLQMDYFLGILWASILGLSIFFWPIRKKYKTILVWIWAAKIAIALLVMLVFEAQYHLDMDGYWTNAIDPTFSWDALRFSVNGTLNTRYLARIHHIIVPFSYHATKMGFSMLGLMGIYQFYRASVFYLQKEDPRLLWILGFMPTILFWSSTVSKDAPSLFFVSLYTLGVTGWYRTKKSTYAAYIFVGILLTMMLRPWYGLVLLLPLPLLLIRLRGNIGLRLLAFSIILLCAKPVTTMLSSTFQITQSEELFETRNVLIGGFTGGGSSIQSQDISSFAGLSLALPYGIISALFRPFIWEATNFFSLLCSLENSFLLMLTVCAIFRTRLRELFEPFILWMFTLLMLWASLYGMVAYNLGSLSRYRLQIMPIFIGLLLLLSQKRQNRPILPTKSLRSSTLN